MPWLPVLEALDHSSGKQANVKRAALIPTDESLGDVSGDKFVVGGETTGDTQRHLGVVGDRPCRLAMSAVSEHLCDASMAVPDGRRLMELNWPTKGITARKTKQCSCSAVVHLDRRFRMSNSKSGRQLKQIVTVSMALTVFMQQVDSINNISLYDITLRQNLPLSLIQPLLLAAHTQRAERTLVHQFSKPHSRQVRQLMLT
jgi:hypothetical protein